MVNRNADKESKAVQIIAAEIAKLPADAPAENLHRSLGYTARKSEAVQMAGQFVRMLYKLEMADEPNDDTERMSIINSLVNAALAVAGK